MSVVYFVVRPSARDPLTKILLCYPFSTSLAYAGGDEGAHLNLYNSFQPGRTRRVSLDRPLDDWPYGDKRPHTVRLPFLLWQFIRNLPGSPAVDVCTSLDLHGDPTVLDGYQLFLSVGHDEYWSKEMRDRVERFVAAGGNAAFFSANTCWWQVRFEDSGRTMICHKSGVEDPLAGADDRRVTGNWASSPTDRPENTLTGVSYRRGTQGGSPTPYTVVDPTDPFFRGALTSGTFGRGIFALETDAADYFIDRDGHFVVTGRDGTPLGFKILAVADMSAESIDQAGRATMGRFTNGGTVFTAATTEWAAHLDDPTIAKITENVVTILSAPARGPAWELLSRPHPTASWTVIDQVGRARAICGVVQGHLLVQGATSVRRCDPEDPSYEWSSTSIPQRADLTAYGSDLLGKQLYAGTSSQGIFHRTPNPASADPWGGPIPPPAVNGRCTGIGAIFGDVFATFRIRGRQYLYQYRSAWRKIGSPVPALAAMTALDGKLFGTRGGALYCRESSPVDLVWTKIGTAPAKTFSLAAYYGRLYALVGTRQRAKLFWRSATAEADTPFRAPSMLFCRGSTLTMGRLSGNGDFETTGSSVLSAAYSHVTRANNGLVFFYHRSSGSGMVCRFSAAGALTAIRAYPIGSFGDWTHVAYVSTGALSGNNEKVFFYNSDGTTGIIGRFEPDTGEFVAEWSSSAFATGWTLIACTNHGRMLFYNGLTGTGAWGVVSNNGTFATVGTAAGFSLGWDALMPAGNTYLFFYRNDGSAALAELDDSFRTLQTWGAGAFDSNWISVASSNGLVLFYGAARGNAVAGGFRRDGFESLRAYPPRAFALDWAHIVGLGILRD